MHYSDLQYLIAVMLSTIFACADYSTKDNFTKINILANNKNKWNLWVSMTRDSKAVHTSTPSMFNPKLRLGFGQIQSRASTPPNPSTPLCTPNPSTPLCTPEPQHPPLHPEPQHPPLHPEPQHPPLHPEPQHPPLHPEPQHPPLHPEPQHPPLHPEPQHPPLHPEPQHPPLHPDPQHPPLRLEAIRSSPASREHAHQTVYVNTALKLHAVFIS